MAKLDIHRWATATSHIRSVSVLGSSQNKCYYGVQSLWNSNNEELRWKTKIRGLQTTYTYRVSNLVLATKTASLCKP